MRYFVIYLAAINLITFCVYGADKRRAKIQGARRVPEKTLFALALLLGSAGALFAMRVFHHKTRHWYFKFGIPAILLAQIALGVFVYVRFFRGVKNFWEIFRFCETKQTFLASN